MLNIQKLNVPVSFGWSELQNISIDASLSAFEKMQGCGKMYEKEFSGTPLAEIPGVQAARHFFRAIGLDPTKRRPSSESLLNRALKNKGFFSVNSLVDVGNWCSLDFLLPICVYDAAHISGDIRIRLGGPNEKYQALNQREMDFENRLVITDDNGAFGSPMTDSLRTAVSASTTHALLGIWAPDSFNEKKLSAHVEIFCTRALQQCGGECVARGMI